MKQTMIFASMLLAGVLMAFTGPKKKVETYTIDAAKSTIAWTGKKLTGEHSGAINFANGALNFNGADLTGGNFSVDMNSITCPEAANLAKHLKSDDFFGVEKFPTAKFVITSVKKLGGDKYELTGKMTIKAATETITFPATVNKGKDGVTGTADIKIDRSKYDVRFGSASFFNDIGNKAIDNIFTLSVKLVANK